MATRKKRFGPSGFEDYYGELYGDSWPELRRALLDEPRYLSLLGTKTYFLDAASYLCGLLANAGPGMRVLDMCAAPGGKSLVLAGLRSRRPALELDGMELTSNELSRPRRARLTRVLDEHLPDTTRRRVTVTGHDASKWGLYEGDRYDRVLADVPCSSERHVLQSEKALSEWSESRPKQLARRQYALLCAAVDSAAPKGLVVYSTCALSEAENDGVVSRVLRRRSERVRPVHLEERIGLLCDEWGLPLPDRTQEGLFFRPDKHGGMGPLYISLLERM